jgi:curved DNA-binding protein CbpA
MTPSNSTRDYYVILEVPPSASLEEIKVSYRRLALLHHPDKNSGSQAATEKIKRVSNGSRAATTAC